AGAATMIPCLLQDWFASLCWARQVLAFTGLDGGFLVQTNQPGPLSQERLRLTIGVEHRTRSLQEGGGIMDMLPGVIAPGTKPFCFEPAPHGTGGKRRQARILPHMPSELRCAPAGEWDLALFGQ